MNALATPLASLIAAVEHAPNLTRQRIQEAQTALAAHARDEDGLIVAKQRNVELQAAFDAAHRLAGDTMKKLNALHGVMTDERLAGLRLVADRDAARTNEAGLRADLAGSERLRDALAGQLGDTIKLLRRYETAENFAKTQTTQCGRCHRVKHTPWRDDAFGYGYICAPCFELTMKEQVAAREEENISIRVEHAKAVEQASDAIKMRDEFRDRYAGVCDELVATKDTLSRVEQARDEADNRAVEAEAELANLRERYSTAAVAVARYVDLVKALDARFDSSYADQGAQEAFGLVRHVDELKEELRQALVGKEPDGPSSSGGAPIRSWRATMEAALAEIAHLPTMRQSFLDTYSGGYHAPEQKAIFDHGMETVFNWLKAVALKWADPEAATKRAATVEAIMPPAPVLETERPTIHEAMAAARESTRVAELDLRFAVQVAARDDYRLLYFVLFRLVEALAPIVRDVNEVIETNTREGK